jgi:hypothetical protein
LLCADVHPFNGRYYDPSIGRYISPDPYLDAPFSSQRLDRYNFGFNNPLRYKRSEALPDVTVDLARGILVAAEGVPAATLTSSFGQLTADLEGARWLAKEALGVVADAGVEEALGGYLVGRISITASKTRLNNPEYVSRSARELFSGIRTLKGTGKPQTVWSELVLTRSQAAELEKTTARLKAFKPKPGSGISRIWAPRVGGRMIPLDLAVSFVLTVGIEVGFSWYEDSQVRDIYGLTDQQMVMRTLVRGFGAAVAFFAGTAAAGVIVVPCLPPVVVGILVGLSVQVAWDWLAAPVAFQMFGLYGPYEPRPALLATRGTRLILGSPLL